MRNVAQQEVGRFCESLKQQEREQIVLCNFRVAEYPLRTQKQTFATQGRRS